MLFFSDGVPVSATKQATEEAPVDEFGAKDLRNVLQLKLDHNSRPLWVVSVYVYQGGF